jgi:phage baseplate assembly protein W
MEATYTDLTTPKFSGLRITEIYDDISINNSLTNIFSTPLGSLPGKPYFGTRIHTMLFEFIDEITMSIITEMINEEVAKFEPRIIVDSVDFDNYPEYNKINININYVYQNKEKLLEGSAAIAFKL